MDNSNDKAASRFDFRTFSILLLISVVPMLVGTWVLFGSYQNAYLDMVGSSFGDTAETAFSLVNTYLQNQIITTAGLTETPLLRATLAEGNLDLKKNLEEVRRAIPKTESAWQGLSREAPLVKSILDNSASQFLRRYSAVNQYYREILVTDFFGRLVASTAKSPYYYFALTDWWKEAYGDGRRGSVYIGDVYYDAAARTYFMDIAQPFVDQDTGVTGIIKVVLDLQGIHAIVGSIQTGSGRSVVLIHAKGDVISAPGFSSLQQTTYPATLDILTAREKGRRFFLSSSIPQSIYGLTARSFQQLYPHLNWIVVTTSKVDDIMGPLRQLRTYFIMLVLAVFLLVLIATLLLSRVESRPVLEEDPHLDKL